MDINSTKKLSGIILVLAILAMAKLGASPTISVVFTLVVLCTGFILLGLLYPPIAVALLFMGHNLFGLVTLTHEKVFVQGILAVCLLFSLILRRILDQKIGCYFSIGSKATWGMIMILSALLIGYIRALTTIAGLDQIISYPLILLKASNAANPSTLPHVFLSRWFVFLAVGALACNSFKEMRVFLAAFAAFIIAQICAIPFGAYLDVLPKLCETGFRTYVVSPFVHAGYVGYLMAMSATVILVFFTIGTTAIGMLGYCTVLVVLFILISIVGAKGPIIAIIMSTAFIYFKATIEGRKKIIYLLGTFFLIAASLVLASQTCRSGLESQFIDTIGGSITTHSALVQEEWRNILKLSSILSLFFGSGFGSSVVTVHPYIYGNEITIITGSHILWLDLLKDIGIVGLGLFAVGLWLVIRAFFISLDAVSNRTDVIRTAVSGLLIVLFIYSLLATIAHVATIFPLIIGVLWGVTVQTEKLELTFERMTGRAASDARVK